MPSTTQTSRSTGDSSTYTPASTPSVSESSHRNSLVPIDQLRDIGTNTNMDETPKETSAAAEAESDNKNPTIKSNEDEEKPEMKKTKSGTCKTKCHGKHKKKKKAVKSTKNKTTATESSSSDSDSESSSESGDDSSEASSSDEEVTKKKMKKLSKQKKDKKKKKSRAVNDTSAEQDSDEDSSEDERIKKKKKAKKVKPKKTKKDKKKRKRKTQQVDDSDSEASSADENETSSDEEPVKRKKKSKKSKKLPESSEDDNTDSEGSDSDNEDDDLQTRIDNLKLRMSGFKTKKARRRSSLKSKKKSSKSSSAEYKRVDQLWDSSIHNYKLKESTEEDDTEFSEFAFLVRRCFNWENKYTDTVVDIKSKILRNALTEVMKSCKSVSLETEEPKLDPNVLFLYLEELRTYYKKTLKAQIKKEKKRKVIKMLKLQKSLVKTLVKYIDEDYAETKKTLYPLLEAGNITFDLMWALFKPNEVAVTSCYGSWDEPRCFKVDFATKFSTMTRGEWYCVEGKYLEYDGKAFGFGEFEVDVDGFKGPKKISSLATYPLKYAKDPAAIRKAIVARGKRFVEMEGMQYKFHKGLAFMKKKKQVAKININGRVMIDPSTFRRINPNYPISFIKPHESDEFLSDDDDDSNCSCCSDSEGDGEALAGNKDLENDNIDDDKPKTKLKLTTDEFGDGIYEEVEVDENGDEIRAHRVEAIAEPTDIKTYTDDELLLTSPVVLGFAFSEKLWLEFSLSGVHEITYNEAAFDSLVVPDNQKSIVRALVESHKFHAAKTIDDVVQGKGKGLVAVLHGPPGTGKTLTAEGISELLRCPLYMVSAGELGTDPARLEHELQKILDIAHSWGAVLLLDEADVFLERREAHDLHRNALVSIFLRLLEYFQGILFLTTNRVETFDEAFASRIHVALRYGELTTKAKKAVWKMFLELVRQAESGTQMAAFTEEELDHLSRRMLNGRQIKNAVRTAQALALNENKSLTMEHVKKVLDVAETFDRDLKGGTGYIDAMRSYT